MNLHSAAVTKIAGSLIALLVLAAGWMLAVGPQTEEVAAARDEVEVVRDQGNELAKRLRDLERARDDLDATREVAAKIAGRFPPTADQPGLFRAITEAAEDAGIGAAGVTDLSPGAPTLGAGAGSEGVSATADAGGEQVAQQEVEVVVEGDYDQTVRLLANIEQMERAYLVTGVDVRDQGEGGGYVTTVRGAMYVMRPVPEP